MYTFITAPQAYDGWEVSSEQLEWTSLDDAIHVLSEDPSFERATVRRFVFPQD